MTRGVRGFLLIAGILLLSAVSANAQAIGSIFGKVTDRFGRRPVFAFMCLGSLIMLPLTYLAPTTYAGGLLLLPLLGFFKVQGFQESWHVH